MPIKADIKSRSRNDCWDAMDFRTERNMRPRLSGTGWLMSTQVSLLQGHFAALIYIDFHGLIRRFWGYHELVNLPTGQTWKMNYSVRCCIDVCQKWLKSGAWSIALAKRKAKGSSRFEAARFVWASIPVHGGITLVSFSCLLGEAAFWILMRWRLKARVRDVSLPCPCICSLLTPMLELCHTKLAVAVSS